MKRHVASDVPRFLVFGGLQIGRRSASPSNQTSNPIAMLTLTNLNSFSTLRLFKDVSILAVILVELVTISSCKETLLLVVLVAVVEHCKHKFL